MKSYKGTGDEVTSDLDFDTVESWFEINNLSDAGVSKACKVDEYSIVVVDDDPYVMQVGRCHVESTDV